MWVEEVRGEDFCLRARGFPWMGRPRATGTGLTAGLRVGPGTRAHARASRRHVRGFKASEAVTLRGRLGLGGEFARHCVPLPAPAVTASGGQLETGMFPRPPPRQGRPPPVPLHAGPLGLPRPAPPPRTLQTRALRAPQGNCVPRA